MMQDNYQRIRQFLPAVIIFLLVATILLVVNKNLGECCHLSSSDDVRQHEESGNLEQVESIAMAAHAKLLPCKLHQSLG